MSQKTLLPDGTRQRWETIERLEQTSFRVFDVETVRRRSPRTARIAPYQIIHSQPWCNIIALTPEDEVVMVEQYRHGIDDYTLEIPGGMVDPGEDPVDAAVRELLEETGYAGDPAIHLSTVHPNPAIQSNTCTTALLHNAIKHQPQSQDEGEDIHVRLVPLSNVMSLITTNVITHTLVISAFYQLEARGSRRLQDSDSMR